MRIGISDDAYITRYGLKEGAKKMLSHGFDCIDYQPLSRTVGSVMTLPEGEFERFLRKTAEEYAAEGLTVWQAHGPWDYPAVYDKSRELREKRFGHMEKAVRGAAYIGTKYIAIHNIMPLGDRDTDPQLTWDVNVDFFGRLAAVAKEYNVVICLENMPFGGQIFARPAETLKLVKALDSENVRMCLDTGHAAVFGISPAEAMREIGTDYIKILHVHDNDGKHDFHWNPYTGWIDWDDFSKSLRDTGFDGCVNLETTVQYLESGLQRDCRELWLANKTKKIAGIDF